MLHGSSNGDVLDYLNTSLCRPSSLFDSDCPIFQRAVVRRSETSTRSNHVVRRFTCLNWASLEGRAKSRSFPGNRLIFLSRDNIPVFLLHRAHVRACESHGFRLIPFHVRWRHLTDSDKPNWLLLYFGLETPVLAVLSKSALYWERCTNGTLSSTVSRGHIPRFDGDESHSVCGLRLIRFSSTTYMYSSCEWRRSDPRRRLLKVVLTSERRLFGPLPLLYLFSGSLCVWSWIALTLREDESSAGRVSFLSISLMIVYGTKFELVAMGRPLLESLSTYSYLASWLLNAFSTFRHTRSALFVCYFVCRSYWSCVSEILFGSRHM